jgi:hypothetical protein
MLQAAAVTGSNTNDNTLPFKRLLVGDHTSDRELEDRSEFTTNPTLVAAVKRVEVRALAGLSNKPSTDRTCLHDTGPLYTYLKPDTMCL